MGVEPRFDYDWLRQFLEANAPQLDCPFCGQNAWETPTLLSNAGVDLPVVDNSGELLRVENARVGVQAYCLTCSTCGFVRLHNITKVNENRPTEDEAH